MSNLKNINPDNDDEIEPPTDGPPPDWMKTATSSAGSSFKENDAPEWLRNIRSGKGTPAKAQAEAEAAGDEPEASSDETMSDLERLLAEEGIDLTGIADERPEGAAGMSVKDWMIATSDDEIIRRKVGAEPLEEAAAPVPEEEPELFPESPAPAPAADFAADVVEDELPDWLREISDEVEISPPLATPAEVRPAAAKPVEEKEALPGDEDLPDWLREVSEQVHAVTPPAVSDTGPVAGQDDLMLGDEGLPDWLQGISDEPVPAAKPIAEFDLETDLEVAGVDEEMPGWLQEVEEEEEDETLVLTSTSDDKLVVTDELPSWLREVEEDQAELSVITPEPEPILPAQALEAEPDILEEELPDWLREDQVTALDTDFGPDFEPAPYPMTDSSDTAIDEENLPDWLRDVQEAEVETERELSELLVAEPAVLEEEELEEIQETELPDWLKEVQAEEEIITPTAPPPVAVEPTPVPPATEAEVVEEELPEWLREAAEESVEAGFGFEVVMEAPPAETKEELPAWLQGVEVAEEEPFEPSEPSPDEFGFGAGEEEIEPALVQEELPGWLKEVQEQSEEIVALEEITAPEVEESVVVETELPEWLQVEAEAEAELPAEPVPTEPEPAVVEVAPPEPEIEAPVEPEPEEAEPVPVELPAPVVVEEVAVPVAAAGLADMPDWLKKLREGDVDVEEEKIAVTAVKPLPKPAMAGPMVSSVVAPEPEPLAEVALPAEAGERLEQARVARDAGNIDEALQHYENLVSSGLHLDRIIEDIKQIIKSYPANAMLYQVMGDAMMKDGRLQSALDAYRTALAKL